MHQSMFSQTTDKCQDIVSNELSRSFHPLCHFCTSFAITKQFTFHSDYNFAPKCINSMLYWNQYHGYLYILISIFLMHILYTILRGYLLNNGFNSMIYKCSSLAIPIKCVFTITNIIMQFSLLHSNFLTYFMFQNVK